MNSQHRARPLPRPFRSRSGRLAAPLLLTALSLAAAAVRAPAQGIHAAGQEVPDRRIPFKSVPGDDDGRAAALSLHVFEPVGLQAGDRRPAIVFFFGGGWVSGTPAQFYPYCRHLAGRGMIAISAEYRTLNSHGVAPDRCVEDGIDAIAWVRAHASELGIDSDRVAAAGGSAGGHVAACTGTGVHPGAAVSRPALLVLFNPVLDTSPAGFRGARVLGDRALGISPLHHVDAAVPPTLILHGDADTVVPVTDATEFQRVMNLRGRECSLALYAGESHAFFNAGRRSHDDTVRVMDAFLLRHGFLEER